MSFIHLLDYYKVVILFVSVGDLADLNDSADVMGEYFSCAAKSLQLFSAHLAALPCIDAVVSAALSGVQADDSRCQQCVLLFLERLVVVNVMIGVNDLFSKYVRCFNNLIYYQFVITVGTVVNLQLITSSLFSLLASNTRVHATDGSSSGSVGGVIFAIKTSHSTEFKVNKVLLILFIFRCYHSCVVAADHCNQRLVA